MIRRVLHVTEASGSGVLSALSSLVSAQLMLEYDVHVLFMTRPDSPDESTLRKAVAGAACRVVPSAGAGKWAAVRRLRLEAANYAMSIRPQIVHAHSTWAGVATRCWQGLGSTDRRAILYTPHGWSFLRQDVPGIGRVAFLLVESLMALGTGGVIAVSTSESRSAPRGWRSDRVEVLENSLRDLPKDCRKEGEGCGVPRVVAAGRVVDQKAPWRFGALAQALGGRAHLIWVGDGPTANKQKWLQDRGVTVTGWKGLEESRRIIQSAAIFVSTSKWEGLPVAVMEAQAMGVPVVATEVQGNRDVIVDGATGLLCRTLDHMQLAVDDLLQHPAKRESFGSLGAQLALSRFSLDVQAARCHRVYARLIPGWGKATGLSA